MTTLPSYVLAMVRREPPIEELVVPYSTPVVSFGNFRIARVATLGINPSNREFEDQNKRLLTGQSQRLENLISLNAASTKSLTDSQVSQVISACDSYFEKNSYSWFTPLEKVIRSGLNVSYFDKTACHLDLVQWSTSSKWQVLSTKVKEKLLDDGKSHLENQLNQALISVVVVNGISVWRELQLAGFVTPEKVGKLTFPNGKTTCQLLVSKNRGLTFLGWTSNLQSQQGANSNQFLQDLAGWLKLQTKSD